IDAPLHGGDRGLDPHLVGAPDPHGLGGRGARLTAVILAGLAHAGEQALPAGHLAALPVPHVHALADALRDRHTGHDLLVAGAVLDARLTDPGGAGLIDALRHHLVDGDRAEALLRHALVPVGRVRLVDVLGAVAGPGGLVGLGDPLVDRDGPVGRGG